MFENRDYSPLTPTNNTIFFKTLTRYGCCRDDRRDGRRLADYAAAVAAGQRCRSRACERKLWLNSERNGDKGKNMRRPRRHYHSGMPTDDRATAANARETTGARRFSSARRRRQSAFAGLLVGSDGSVFVAVAAVVVE